MAARPDTPPDGKSTRPASSRDDLERYGVWVKAEPQDITPEPELGAGFEESLDLPEESFLTEEEERLLGSFEDIEEAEGFAEPERKPLAGGGEDIFGSLPEIEDFALPSEEELPAPAAAEDLEFELSMEDLSAGFQESPIDPSTPIDIEKVEGLGAPLEEESFDMPELELPEEEPRRAAKAPMAPELSAGPQIEDVSAEFLDEAFGDSEPASATAVHDVTDEFLEGEGAKAPEPAAAEPDFEPLDIELHFDGEESPALAIDHASAGFEELGELDGMLEAPANPAPAPEFDDLAALEKELSAEPAEVAPRAQGPRAGGQARSAAPAAEPGLANELLLKIANELSSIRGELITLKSQLAASKTEEGPLTLAAEEEAEGDSAGGFFDEEDDEKIALTGDELDNILSSADFTEESSGESFAEGEGLSLAESAEAGALLAEEGILPESGDYALPVEAVERISLEEEEPTLLAEPPAAEDDHLIRRIAEEGIAPLTSAPEDTSYLEEPLEEEQILDMSETPFVEAPLVEPDISELSIDLGVDEEEMEVSGELPVMESEELADLTLDLEAVEAPPAEEELPLPLEGEVLPEFEEEAGFEDIELAAESPEAQAPLEEESLEGFDLETALPLEEELHHEDLGAPLPGAEEEEKLSLDEDLFVPGPAGEEEISLSSRPAGLEREEPAEAFAEEAIPFAEEPEAFAEENIFSEEGLGLPEEELPEEKAPAAKPRVPAPLAAEADPTEKLKSDIRSVLSYLDRLLESLPEEKIEEFAHSEHFDTYKKLFEELGLV